MASPQTENGYTRIANEILEELAAMNFSPYETRVLFAIFRKTYGYNKKADRISLSQLDVFTKIGRVSTSKAIRKLELRGVIKVSRVERIPVIEFNKDYDEWGKSLYIYRDTRPWYHKKDKCEFCRKNKSMEKHHIIPKEMRGSQTKSENIAYVCEDCHGLIHRFMENNEINTPEKFQLLYSMLIKLMSSELTTSIWNRVLPEWETLVSAEQTTKVSSKQTTTKDKRKVKDNNTKDNITLMSFDSFWSIYPKKVGKKSALTQWNKLSKEEQEIVLADIPKRKSDDKWINGFVKDPERYLKHRQWEDEIILPRGKILNLNTGGKPGKFANVGTKI